MKIKEIIIIKSSTGKGSTPLYLKYDSNHHPDDFYMKGYDFIWGLQNATHYDNIDDAEAAFQAAYDVFDDLYNNSDITFMAVKRVPWWKFWIKTEWVELYEIK